MTTNKSTVFLTPKQLYELIEKKHTMLLHQDNFLMIETDKCGDPCNREKLVVTAEDLLTLMQTKTLKVQVKTSQMKDWLGDTVTFEVRDRAQEYVDLIKDSQEACLSELANVVAKLNDMSGHYEKQPYTRDEALKIIKDCYFLLGNLRDNVQPDDREKVITAMAEQEGIMTMTAKLLFA